MKIPALLMASLFTVSVTAQATRPVIKTTKKTVKKSGKIKAARIKNPQPTAKKDTVVVSHGYCPACGMG
ncbi:hypothetical protein SD427_10875 [Chryseobacterium sp. JJR-5R]|uniref:MNIO class RiPP chryseobasin precursor ChrA n=1 Tax=Chryseobacterium sp. JJR-5R TaxID=3093923 RepID=UPI002A748C76|nr:hypothetical protein [Chryseobacterium sp. JJR-5R]WPO81265.1 hypothetical protein SD427_10875 [Chryseobacterium sp. JJR-5R]